MTVIGINVKDKYAENVILKMDNFMKDIEIRILLLDSEKKLKVLLLINVKNNIKHIKFYKLLYFNMFLMIILLKVDRTYYEGQFLDGKPDENALW